MVEEEKVMWMALDKRVIAVAVKGCVGDWAAYIGAVAGNRHIDEWRNVAERGSKLPKSVAEAIFPEFKRFNWRY